jgi:hypothetical protein
VGRHHNPKTAILIVARCHSSCRLTLIMTVYTRVSWERTVCADTVAVDEDFLEAIQLILPNHLQLQVKYCLNG